MCHWFEGSDRLWVFIFFIFGISLHLIDLSYESDLRDFSVCTYATVPPRRWDESC